MRKFSGNSLLGISFTLMGGLAVYAGLYAWQKESKAVQLWQPAEGKIVSRYIQEKWENSGDRRELNYHLHITYSFSLAGQTSYQGSYFSPSVDSLHLSNKSDNGQYQVGETVTVYYNPQSPQENALEKSTPAIQKLLIIALGLVFVIVGIIYATRGFS